MPILNPLACPRWDRAGRTPGVRTNAGCCGKNRRQIFRTMALEAAEKNRVGVRGIWTSGLCRPPTPTQWPQTSTWFFSYTKFKSKPPNSNMVFLSRFKSHRPKNLAASFIAQQPTLVLTPGVRPARFHRGHRRGFEMGIC
jgi:hypothetical protein